MKETGEATTALSIEKLTITLPDGRRLFDRADLHVRAGELIVLVGPSGSGKTTLLRRIAGLDDPDDAELATTGCVEVHPAASAGKSPAAHAVATNAAVRSHVDRPNGNRPCVGMVFQIHALLDELSAVRNVQFAIDHRPDAERVDPDLANRLLSELGVPVSGKLSTLSGGERQRVAVARTLAMDPPVLLFDEPTGGLDPGRSRAVATMIAETHRRSDKTVIIVTHDVDPFLPHQPRLVLLDASSGTLRDVDALELADFFREPPGVAPTGSIAPREGAFARHALGWVDQPGRVMLALLASLWVPLFGWRRPAWRLRYLWHYIRMVAVGATALYVAIAGAMLGFVFVSFSFSQLPYTEVTVPLLTEEFLAATGYSTFRIVIPLLIAVLMAGKCGASIAADVGARRLTHQYDAMRNCGARPEHYLFGNAVCAMLIGSFFLTAIACVSNAYASLVAFLSASPDATVALFQRNFYAIMWPEGQLLPRGSGWVALKMACSGLLVASLSYAIGARPKESSTDVSRDVGLTIFWASLGVLVVHALYSFVEF